MSSNGAKKKCTSERFDGFYVLVLSIWRCCENIFMRCHIWSLSKLQRKLWDGLFPGISVCTLLVVTSSFLWVLDLFVPQKISRKFVAFLFCVIENFAMTAMRPRLPTKVLSSKSCVVSRGDKFQLLSFHANFILMFYVPLIFFLWY